MGIPHPDLDRCCRQATIRAIAVDFAASSTSRADLAIAAGRDTTTNLPISIGLDNTTDRLDPTRTTMDLNNRQLYNASVASWRRNGPVILSDFTARPRVIEVLGDISGLHLWDLGCGEGLLGRQLAAAKPARIDGFDLSEQMVEAAREQAAALASDQGGPLHYSVADLADPAQLPSGTCDAAVAVFLFNYLDLQATEQVLGWVRQALRPGGSFTFTVPHPSLAFLRPAEAPFYIEPGNHPYLGSSDQLLEGRIWRRDGISNAIRSRHKTLEDYNRILRRSGWTRMPLVEELGVSDDHINQDPAFFGPLRGTPLHLLFQVQA